MIKWLKKYWWVIAIIVAPIAINFILQIPAFVCIIGDNTDWLTFWGSYLGTIISTLTALFVLFRTLQQNHEENERNRLENEKANERNRQLQVKVLEYQQQMQWLNSFRQASTQYIQMYNTNDLIAISNVLAFNLNEAHNMLKPIFDRITMCNTSLAYFGRNDKDSEELMKKIFPIYQQYNEALNDIQSIITFKANKSFAMFSQLVLDMAGLSISQTMKGKILDTSKKTFDNVMQPFVDVVLARIYDIDGLQQNVQNLLYAYIQSEQTRINKILEN